MLLLENQVAFKEWAVICAALLAGRQSMLLRKGGIAEANSQFQPEHQQFWLLPTFVHQSPDAVVPAVRSLFDRVQSAAPPANQIRLEAYAVSVGAYWVDSLDRLLALADCHCWADQTVRDRFHYRRPGLFLLPVRVFRTPTPIILQASSELAGCRSWARLPNSVSTTGLIPVLDDVEFQSQLAGVTAHLC